MGGANYDDLQKILKPVTPANPGSESGAGTGVYLLRIDWIPAFAGMTTKMNNYLFTRP
jgi:hypothetical protein